MNNTKVYAYRRGGNPNDVKDFSELSWKLLSSKNQWVKVDGPAGQTKPETAHTFVPDEVIKVHALKLQGEGKTVEEIAATLKQPVEKINAVLGVEETAPETTDVAEGENANAQATNEPVGDEASAGDEPADAPSDAAANETADPTDFEKRALQLHNEGKKNGEIAKLLTDELKPEKAFHHTQVKAAIDKFKQ